MKIFQKTLEFEKRVRNGEALDNILPEAFGLVRELPKDLEMNVIMMFN